jgi:WD40 repeat protein
MKRQRLGKPFTGHSSWVSSVAFSPDGQTLASGSWERIILWDVAKHRRLGVPLTGHSGVVQSLAFSPDGKILVSGSTGNGVMLWDVDLESWKARICEMAGRNFTQEEWEQYFGERGEPYHKTCEQWPEGQ